MTAGRHRWTRRALRRFGFDVIRYPEHLVAHKRVRLLQHHDIGQVFDVGANTGGYGRELREFGYQGQIVSFEPLAEPYAQLRKIADADPRWTAVKVALGPSSTRARMNVAANSTSSSLLPMRTAHRRAAPWATYVGEEDVSVTTLDDVFPRYGDGTAPFLKMDVQGYEEQVLAGAAESLARIQGVQLEMSLVPLYDGSWLFTDALRHLEATGFVLVSLEPGFYDRTTGRLLQVDGVFMRPRSRYAG